MKLVKTACMALSFFVTTALVEASECDAQAAEEKSATRLRRDEHLQTTSPIGALLHHPAFSGYARLLLPWDDRDYDEHLPLIQIGTLLPYHSHIDPETTVVALNHMVDEVGNGNTVFYDFYSAAEKEAQPTKQNTGLFFFAVSPARRSRSSHQAADSLMSARYMKVFLMP